MAKTNQATLPNASSGVRMCESSERIIIENSPELVRMATGAGGLEVRVIVWAINRFDLDLNQPLISCILLKR